MGVGGLGIIEINLSMISVNFVQILAKISTK